MVNPFFQFLLFTSALLPLIGRAQSTLVPGFDHPESVWPTPGVVYVSNIGKELKPSDKDGDGYISRLDPRGRVLEQRFLTGLNAPKGMAVVRGVLYVADIDRIVGFNLRTKSVVFELDFTSEKTQLLNDLVIRDAQTLFVSATDRGKVYQVNLSAKTYTALPGTTNGPNGLFFDADRRRLFVVGYGSNGQPGDIGVFEEQNGQMIYRTLLPRAGVFDGVTLLNGKVALVTDWGTTSRPGGKLWRLDLTSNTLKPYAALTNLSGPADFGVFGQMLYLPQLTAGTVLVQRMD
ncbi:hypothetical protein HNV11_02805 [Spirosoma taeanense]|uniref:Uncharacterized protein n=1 Tax=Spirosoma taeanense TaxID=2735870 RepID=A0A6M5Y0S0_9BACT|nr:hypothetical protein [Spirosoma taeanense]QJW88377.1 hypothetical protein HNV11_02805 [Spirosoma taeanense]